MKIMSEPTPTRSSGSSPKGPKHWLRYLWREWVFPLGVAFLIAYAFRSTIASPRHIPTGSMIPTIKIGEFIFVKMYHYDWHIPMTRTSFAHRGNPKRGEVVVFEFPEDSSKDYIKRVVAIPGDIIEVRDDRIILNGEPLPRREILDRSVLNDLVPKYDPDDLELYMETIDGIEHEVIYSRTKRVSDMPAYRVPESCFFVMGDNRDDSYDSRFWGCVPREKLLGRAAFRWFSLNWDRAPFVRFNRLFQWVD